MLAARLAGMKLGGSSVSTSQSRYRTVALVVVVALGRLYDDAFATSCSTVAEGALTRTFILTVHVLPGPITLFSLQVTGPLPPIAGTVHDPTPGVPESAILENVVPAGTCVLKTS